ncbi:hypothetical protein [Paenibacillus pini]
MRLERFIFDQFRIDVTNNKALEKSEERKKDRDRNFFISYIPINCNQKIVKQMR